MAMGQLKEVSKILGTPFDLAMDVIEIDAY
jgi:hypothetical protein